MIIKNNQLTNDQFLEIKELFQACQTFDQYCIPLYEPILQGPRDYPCNVLYYENEKLIGFLSLFFFYDDGVEVVILVHPKKRKQGISHKMLDSMRNFFKLHQVKRLIFPTVYDKDTTWLQKKNFTYLSSLFQMQRSSRKHASVKISVTISTHLNVKKASYQDIDFLCQVDKACFKCSGYNMEERFEALLQNPSYRIYIAFLEGIPVGKAHIYWHTAGVQLLDIAVLPEHQKKGLGHALIAFCINTLISEGSSHLALDVELSNKNAIKLYSNLDFQIFNAYHYWCFKLA